jgi:membrane-bound serine protease (ClpP class)
MLFILMILPLLTGKIYAQNPDSLRKKVFVMEIKDNIDPRMNRYVDLALKSATEQNADIIIIEMDTYGGAVNDADDIRTAIMNYEKPVWVFINKDAASAGALISIACDSIYMAPGASIGAATVVVGDGTAAPDKYQSYMRSIMRSTAEAQGRDPKIAEAMVDQNLEVEGVSKAGEVVTFSTSEAIKHGFCEGEVKNIEEILAKNGVGNYERLDYSLSTVEKIIALFLNPFVSGILILVIIGGIYFELQTPGVGFPILAALIAIILYFTPYYLNGLAENWEIIVFFLGVILIAVEVFVLPGFGVAGISGIILMLTGLILAMLENDGFDFKFVNPEAFVSAISAVMGGMIAGVIAIFVGGSRFTKSSMFKRLALAGVMDAKEGYTSNFKEDVLIGKRGVAFTILRPSGKVSVDGVMYDAFTRGEYIEKGAEIEVIDDRGMSLKVVLVPTEKKQKSAPKAEKKEKAEKVEDKEKPKTPKKKKEE